jgi:acyl-CoA reductase-like NAD-dependent aldehyde dehydrogenase
LLIGFLEDGLYLTWTEQSCERKGQCGLVAEFPWGGFKESGLGKETGVLGLEAYTQTKLVCVKYA